MPSVACSAYRKYHSTKTAVLSVLEGLLTKSDQKLVSILALLDLSAAFDTLDHAILLRRLESTFGISEVALSWFESYLSDRTQSVVVDGLISTPIPLVFGVPQGSVLGPVLFTLYSQLLSDVTPVTITSTLMTQKSLAMHHLAISPLLSPTFNPV